MNDFITMSFFLGFDKNQKDVLSNHSFRELENEQVDIIHILSDKLSKSGSSLFRRLDLQVYY